jgi:hypothetical protein
MRSTVKRVIDSLHRPSYDLRTGIPESLGTAGSKGEGAMGDTSATDYELSEEEIQEFWEKVGAFRDELPSGEREAFNAIVAGATQAAERTADAGTDEAAAFGRRLSTFREGLPPRQREAFNSVVAAGVAEIGARGDDVQGYVLPMLGGGAAAVVGGIGVFSAGMMLGIGAVEAGVGGRVMTPKEIEEHLKKGKGGTPPA